VDYAADPNEDVVVAAAAGWDPMAAVSAIGVA
jgi:hypothetical protein